jgi:hypothetical protein
MEVQARMAVGRIMAAAVVALRYHLPQVFQTTAAQVAQVPFGLSGAMDALTHQQIPLTFDGGLTGPLSKWYDKYINEVKECNNFLISCNTPAATETRQDYQSVSHIPD